MIFTADVYYTYINFDILRCWKSYNCITGCYIEMFWCCQRHLSIFEFAWQVSVAKLLKRLSAIKNKSPFCLVIKLPNQDGETGQGNAIDSVERWIVFTEYCYAKMKRVVFKLNFCCRSWIIWCKEFLGPIVKIVTLRYGWNSGLIQRLPNLNQARSTKLTTISI